MSYVVFARKYRPQTFADVVGQEHVGRTLLNAIDGERVAHAYLFCGPRGVGKTSMARILSKAINCLKTPGEHPCGVCETCLGVSSGSDVDVLEIDAASNRRVEEVQPLIDSARYLPQRAPKKIFIVDEAHMLSITAFNALLKTLEEPPPHVLFILATTEPHKIPETVRSRCQRFDFRRISQADIERKLQRIVDAEGATVEAGILDEIARRATGGLRDAESLLDQSLSAAPRDRSLALTDLVSILGGIPREVRDTILLEAHAGKSVEVLGAASSIVDAGADPAELLRDLYSDLRDRAVRAAVGATGRDGGLAGPDSAPGVEWCLAAAELVARHQQLAATSRAARSALDLCLLAMARLGDVQDLETLVARLESLGGAAGTGTVIPVAAPVIPPRPVPSPQNPVATQNPVAAPPTPPAKGPRPSAAPQGLAKFLPPSAQSADSPPEAAAPAREPSGPKSEAPERDSGPDGLGNTASATENVPSAQTVPAQKPQGEDRGPQKENRVLSSEEMQRIRALPVVDGLLSEFRGRIEHIKLAQQD